MSEKSFGWTSLESFDAKMSFSEDDNSFMKEQDLKKTKNINQNSNLDENDLLKQVKNESIDGIDDKLEGEENEASSKKKKKRKLRPPLCDDSELEGKKYKEKSHKKFEIESNETLNIAQAIRYSVSDDPVIHKNKKTKKKKKKETEKFENGYEDANSIQDLSPTVEIKKEKKNKKGGSVQQESFVVKVKMSDDLGDIKEEGTHNESHKKKKHKSRDKTLEDTTNSTSVDTRDVKSQKKKKVKKEDPDLPDENCKYDEPDCRQNPSESINNSTKRKGNIMPGVNSRKSSSISETETIQLIRKNSFHYESPTEDTTTRQDTNSSPISEFSTRKNSFHFISPDENEPIDNSLTKRTNEKHSTMLSDEDEQVSEASLHKRDKATKNQWLNNEEEQSRPISKQKSPTLVRKSNVQRKIRSNSLIDTSDSSNDDIRPSRNEFSQIANKKTKTSSISDKIRFESEHSDYGSDFPQEKLKEAFDNYVNLKRVIPSFFEKTSMCPETDEIWLMKCPSSIEISNLKGLTLPIEEKTKFKIDNQRYECFMDVSNHKNLTIITPNPGKNGTYKLQTFPCLGEIKLRNKFPKLHIDESTHIVNKHSFIPLPDTKKRHPLFGVEYKPLIKLNKDVAEKLQSANKKIKSKKKVKKEKLMDVQSEIYKRKKRKRKMSSNEDTDDKLVVKKHKKNLSDVIWNSEKAMEENLFANY